MKLGSVAQVIMTLKQATLRPARVQTGPREASPDKTGGLWTLPSSEPESKRSMRVTR